MELLIVCIAALLASALTLFSGFGLGTLLMPVVALLPAGAGDCHDGHGPSGEQPF